MGFVEKGRQVGVPAYGEIIQAGSGLAYINPDGE